MNTSIEHELYLIALIYQNDKPSGFRLFDLGNNEIADVKIDSVIKKLFQSKAKIKNLENYVDYYKYEDDFDSYKEDIMRSLGNAIPIIYKDNKDENRNKIAILRDTDGIVWVRIDGIVRYELTNDINKLNKVLRDVTNVYEYKGEIHVYDDMLVMDINSSIFQDKIYKMKKSAINFNKQAKIIEVSGVHKGLNFNNFGEVYINGELIKDFNRNKIPLKIELPIHFNKIIRSDTYIPYDSNIHVVFNKNLREIGNSTFKDIPRLLLLNTEQCYLEKIEPKAFATIELMSTLDKSWNFNKPCYIESNAFLKANIDTNGLFNLNIDKIEKYGFAYVGLNSVMALHSTKDGYGIIDDEGFIGIRTSKSIILGDNLELHDNIFGYSVLDIVILNSDNIKVYDGCIPFSNCKIKTLIIAKGCSRIPDELFNGADIENIKIENKRLSIGKRSFANMILNENTVSIFGHELDIIDERGFENLSISDTDNIIDDINIKALEIRDRAFEGTILNLYKLSIQCNKIGDNVFANSFLELDKLSVNMLGIGMFENAKLKLRKNSYDINLLDECIIRNIPDRAFKNAITNASIMQIVKKTTTIGREAFKGFIDKHIDNFTDYLEISADMIDASAFEDAKFIGNVYKIKVICPDIRDSAFYRMCVNTKRENNYELIELQLYIRNVGRCAFNDLKNIRDIMIYDTINIYGEDKSEILSIDDNNFHLEPEVVSISSFVTLSDNRDIVSKFQTWG